MRLSKARCFDFMDEAHQAPVRLECGPDVERIRQGFYRARQYCQARSNYRYDDWPSIATALTAPKRGYGVSKGHGASRVRCF